MIDITDPPSGFRDVDWLLFFGWISDRYDTQVVLQPAEDADISITMASQDVYDFPNNPPIASVNGKPITPVFVRRFARAWSIEFTASSQFQQRAVTPYRANSNCPGTRSHCLGNVEYCCDNYVAVGGCYGRWRC
jgi:hypothetical protein